MFVLGIDPGLSRCGYGLLRVESGRADALAAGVLTTDPRDALPGRLALLRHELAGLVAEFAPDVVVVERVFFQTNARTAMSVGQASGVALLTAAESGCAIAEYTSNEVKLAVTGHGAASKEQVQQMMAVLLGLAEVPRPPDAADALALAFCHVAVARLARPLLGGAPGVSPPALAASAAPFSRPRA